MFINIKDGYAVTLLAQDAESVCHYSQDGGETLTMPSHQFFAEFREAEPNEKAPAKKTDKSPPT